MATLMAARGGVATSSAASSRPAPFASTSSPFGSSLRVPTASKQRRSTRALAASLTTQEQLPASHASQAALEQLRAASSGGVNRKLEERAGDPESGGVGDLIFGQVEIELRGSEGKKNGNDGPPRERNKAAIPPSLTRPRGAFTIFSRASFPLGAVVERDAAARVRDIEERARRALERGVDSASANAVAAAARRKTRPAFGHGDAALHSHSPPRCYSFGPESEAERAPCRSPATED